MEEEASGKIKYIFGYVYINIEITISPLKKKKMVNNIHFCKVLLSPYLFYSFDLQM
jgi:hypothetical protein